MLVPRKDPDLVSSISWNYIFNTYIDINNNRKNIPTQKVENQMAICDGMYNKYYVQILKYIREYYKKKLVVDSNSF